MYKKHYSKAFIVSKIKKLEDKIPSLIRSKISNEDLRDIVVNYFSSMAQYTFSEIKSVLRDRFNEFNLPTKEDLKTIIVDLENEYAVNEKLEYLGIEDAFSIKVFTENQWKWLTANFRFSIDGFTLGELIQMNHEVYEDITDVSWSA